MRLTEFIKEHHDDIIAEWTAFAQTLLPWAKGLSQTDLRDHADELLSAVVSDMNSAQSRAEQVEKSKGHAPPGQLARIGQRHAADRLESGLDMDQMVSEYRSLRACVMRLWEEATSTESEEVTRFNEAIDEALAESMARYTLTVTKTRERFLGILGHDLRNPLGAILMGTRLLQESPNEDVGEITNVILRSGERMSRMVDDLLDFTRSRLGTGIPVTPQPMDLSLVCRHVLAELRPTHPHSPLVFTANGDLNGEWDSDRIAQVISNVVGNALQHSDLDAPVTVEARGATDEVVVTVHNDGPPIAKNLLKTLFDPMTRHVSTEKADKNSSGLGLGLFIASEIMTAHHGAIEVSSTAESGTIFKLRLPRRPLSLGRKAEPRARQERLSSEI